MVNWIMLVKPKKSLKRQKWKMMNTKLLQKNILITGMKIVIKSMFIFLSPCLTALRGPDSLVSVLVSGTNSKIN